MLWAPKIESCLTKGPATTLSAQVETLESRELFTVTAATLVGTLTVGSTWNYDGSSTVSIQADKPGTVAVASTQVYANADSTAALTLLSAINTRIVAIRSGQSVSLHVPFA